MISLFLPNTNYMYSFMVDIRQGQHKREKIALRGSLGIESFSDNASIKLPKLKIFIDDKEVVASGKRLKNIIAGTYSLKVLVENVQKIRQIEIRPDSPLLVRYKITRKAPQAPPDNSNNADNVSF